MSAGAIVVLMPPVAILAGLAVAGLGGLVSLGCGAFKLGVSGMEATVAGVGAVSSTAADGVLALSAGALEAWRKRFAGGPPVTAGRAGMHYMYFTLPIAAEAETTLGEVLKGMGLPLGQAATLRLTDDRSLPLDHVVWDESGQLLLGVRSNSKGALEAVCAGEGGFQVLNTAVMNTVLELAKATLGLQGFEEIERTVAADSGYKILMARRTARSADQVRLTYIPKTGELRIDSRGMLATGRPALRDDCPDTAAFLRHFTHHKQGEEWKPDLEPMEEHLPGKHRKSHPERRPRRQGEEDLRPQPGQGTRQQGVE